MDEKGQTLKSYPKIEELSCNLPEQTKTLLNGVGVERTTNGEIDPGGCLKTVLLLNTWRKDGNYGA